MSKIIAVSDLHIGQEISNTGKIDRFLDMIDDTVDLLVLDGDILDLWRMKYDQIERENRDLLDKLRAVSFFTPTVWLLGNHDSHVPKKSFPEIRFEKSYDYEEWHFEHGHMFDVGMKKYTWAFKIITTIFPQFYQMFFKSPSEIIMEDEGSSLLPMHEKAQEYANDHDINVCVGHSHQPQMVCDGNHWVCDCGDVIDSNSYIEILDGFPQLRRIWNI